jgi:hypothetical protein
MLRQCRNHGGNHGFGVQQPLQDETLAFWEGKRGVCFIDFMVILWHLNGMLMGM